MTIGLFGTCGDSQWRTPIMEIYDKYNINYFNPVVKNRKTEDVQIKAEHLAKMYNIRNGFIPFLA